MNLEGLERFSFGDGSARVDERLALVLSGRKTATCWAARNGGFADDMDLWCERFRVVARLGPAE